MSHGNRDSNSNHGCANRSTQKTLHSNIICHCSNQGRAGLPSGSMCGRSTNDNSTTEALGLHYECLDQLPSVVLWKTLGLCFGNVSSQSGLLIKYFQILHQEKIQSSENDKSYISLTVYRRIGKSTLQRHKPSFIFHEVRWFCSWRGGALQQDFRIRKLVK